MVMPLSIEPVPMASPVVMLPVVTAPLEAVRWTYDLGRKDDTPPVMIAPCTLMLPELLDSVTLELFAPPVVIPAVVIPFVPLRSTDASVGAAPAPSVRSCTPEVMVEVIACP